MPHSLLTNAQKNFVDWAFILTKGESVKTGVGLQLKTAQNRVRKKGKSGLCACVSNWKCRHCTAFCYLLIRYWRLGSRKSKNFRLSSSSYARLLLSLQDEFKKRGGMKAKELSFEQKEQLYRQLCQMLAPERVALIEKNIEKRTDWLTAVVEDVYQPHNASAVLRTCDCLGLQQVHIIENHNEYRVNPDVALGASYWLDLYRYNRKAENTADCFQKLKAQGYKIVATLPAEKDVSLPQIDVSSPLALVFGNELEGLSQTVKDMADVCMKIPMYGFTESYNISVSAAISLYTLNEKLRSSNIDYSLGKERRLDTLIKWAKHSIRHSDKVEKELIKRLFNLE